jgi:vacuolar-type H+-ATPase subunit E/Vma4
MTSNVDQQPVTGGNVTASLKAKLEARRAQEAAQQPQVLAPFYQADVDDLRDTLRQANTKTDYQRAVDAACESITVREAYNKLSKNIYKYEHQRSASPTTEVKVSCPIPGHGDANPSAQLNDSALHKNGKYDGGVGHCKTCDQGFDKYHIAAWAYGLDYKSQYNDICEQMAAEFRGVVKPPPIIHAAPAILVDDSESAVPSVAPQQMSPATEDEDAARIEDETLYPTYRLVDILPGATTFLDLFCAEGLKADIPREFPLWAGLAALSVAIGRTVALKMIENPTYCNLNICLTARSGAGKGRSTRPVGRVLRDVLPYEDEPLTAGLPPEGVRVMKLDGSAEKLIRQLEILAPKGSGTARYTTPALVEFDEMQTLVSKAAGSSAYKSYIIEFADCIDRIYTGSNVHGTAEVVNGFVTMLTGTQPKHLRDQFTRRDMASGLLNRFIFPFGRAVEQQPWGLPEQNWTAVSPALALIVKWATSLQSNTPTGSGYWIAQDSWDDDARDEWIRFFTARIGPDKTGDNSDLLARMDSNMMKLILLFACNEMSERIRLRHVRSAFALYDYLSGCALNLANEINRTELSDQMKVILDAVAHLEETLKKPPTKRDLRKIRAIEKMNEDEFSKVVYKLMTTKQLFYVVTKSRSGRGRAGNAYTTNIAQWDTTCSVEVTAASAT